VSPLKIYHDFTKLATVLEPRAFELMLIGLSADKKGGLTGC
jgi:hypothetical protein